MDPLKEEAPRRERIAFVTGRLAERALRDELARLAPEAGFAYDVVVLNIAVAALMTADWVARRVRLPGEFDRAIYPGHLRGDVDLLERATGVPAQLGPKDLRALPLHFGRAATRDDAYGDFTIEILAEINHVPRLALEETLAVASRYRDDGADVIDLGCDPDGPFEGVADVVRAVRSAGMRVSVDSLDPAEIVPAVEAGAELVLSVNARNVRAVAGVRCEVVVIPDDPVTLGGLDESIARLDAAGTPYRIDPVLEPIGFGFARSLGRYLEVRRRYPDARMLLGAGNLTELTGVDSAAINTLLAGFCEELGITSVLTTEVAPWCRTSVRELDLARRLVHHAVARQQVPKRVEPDLHLLRDEAVLEHGLSQLAELARNLRDRNFRVFAEAGEIHVINSEGYVRGTDPFALFEQLDVTDTSHAFYLGYELAKAVTALTLGKNYVQDQALRWGFLTREEKGALGHSGLDERPDREEDEAREEPRYEEEPPTKSPGGGERA